MNKSIDEFKSLIDEEFITKGKLFYNKSLKNISWFKAGGRAGVLYIPRDQYDLSWFFGMLESAGIHPKINVFGR